jgi:hypothetical protein
MLARIEGGVEARREEAFRREEGTRKVDVKKF